MATIIRTQGLSINPELRTHLARRLTFALRRFQNRITQTEVYVKGPVEGSHNKDRRVVVKVGLVDREPVVVESSAHNHFIAVSLAARRCKRALRRAFKQPLARRRDGARLKAFEPTRSPAAELG
jgi:ribosome-associated translation inhibitor RaiA